MSSMDPKVAALIVFAWGLGSLLLIATRTNSVKSAFLKKPSILIGDFFLVPLGVYLTVDDLTKTNVNFGNVFVTLSGVVAIITSFMLALISVIRNHLTNLLWLPHVVFYWAMWSLAIFFLTSRFSLSSILWWTVLLIVVLHQCLGVFYPKKFPKVE